MQQIFNRLKQVVFKPDTLPWKVESSLIDSKEMIVNLLGILFAFAVSIVISLILAWSVLKFGIFGTIGIMLCAGITSMTLYRLRHVFRYVVKGE